MLDAKQYRCDICGHVGPWTDDWQWWGSQKNLDEYGLRGIVVTCSDGCRQAAQPALILQERGVKP